MQQAYRTVVVGRVTRIGLCVVFNVIVLAQLLYTPCNLFIFFICLKI